MARINTRPSYQSTAASSRYPSATPAPSDTSDQENADPSRRRMDKGKGRASDLRSRTSLPTPTSDEISEARAGQKRKRGPTRALQPEEEDVGEDELAERKFNRYYDPNQDPEERREVKRKSRALERQFQGRCTMSAKLVSNLLILSRTTRRPSPRRWQRAQTHCPAS